MEVDKGEEDEDEVNGGKHAGCREDNDDGEGIKLLGEEVATGGVGTMAASWW